MVMSTGKWAAVIGKVTRLLIASFKEFALTILSTFHSVYKIKEGPAVHI